mgnify:CR=1 FL=1
MRDKKVLFTTQAAMIAALYVALTLLANALGLANYAVQVRISLVKNKHPKLWTVKDAYFFL